jgi:hypothetical protein
MVLARGACCFPNTTTNCSGKPKKTGEQCYNKTETACTNEYGVWHSGKKCKNGCCPKLDPVPTSLIIPPTNLNPLISSDPQPDSTPPSAPSSKSTTREQITAEKTAQKLKERRKEQQNLEQKRNQEKIKWLIGGSKTITVKVVPNKNRSFSFSINGKNPNEPLELIRGITYRFNQTDKSNGLSGISHQEHPIMFSKGKDGKHNNHFSLPVVKSNKLPGNRGSYLYFTAQVTGSLYYYCQNHPNMEGIINVIDDVGEQRSQDIQEEKLKILVAEINTCCDEDCLLCILDSIRIVESGGVDNQCNTPSTDDGDDCGPYQIGQDYWDDALKSCSFPGRSAPLPGGKNCCDLKKYSHSKLCDPCLAGPGYDACCEEKERMSKLAIQCYWRLHTRNCGGSTDEPCCQCGNCGIPDCNINSDCAGNVYIPRSSNPNQDSFLGCFTCEDLARIHNDGPDWCENTSQTNNYIRKIKEALCNSENPHCKACCGSTGKFGCGCSPENDKNRLDPITT